MCRGQGGLALAGGDLDAQVSYQRSLQSGGPFLAIVSVEGDVVRGEVTQGAVVDVFGAFGRVHAEVDGHVWRCILPPGGGSTAWKAEVVADRKRAVLDPGRAPFITEGGS